MSKHVNLLDDIPRGTLTGHGQVTSLGDYLTPCAPFHDPAAIAAADMLRPAEDRIVLGVVSSEAERSPLPDGCGETHVHGGIRGAIGDDRHLIKVGSSRGSDNPMVILMPDNPVLVKDAGLSAIFG